MNKNVENYKKAVDQIHVDPNLKDKVLEEANYKKKSKSPIYYLRIATAIAAVAVVAVVGVAFWQKPKDEILNPKTSKKITEQEQEKTQDLAKVDIRRFESMKELRDALEKNQNSSRGIYYATDVVEESEAVSDVAKSANDLAESFNSTDTSGASNSEDYSRTNNQVESVDEADIVKTDGKYIYYSQNNRVYIADNDLNLKATIKDENVRPYQIFVNGNKLVVFGTEYNGNSDIVYYNTITKEDVAVDDSITKENIVSYYRPKTLIRVYDLSNIESPKVSREIRVDGNYQDARMIENNVYLVTCYTPYFYGRIDEIKDTELLPTYKDSVINETKCIEATDIAYFEDTRKLRIFINYWI